MPSRLNLAGYLLDARVAEGRGDRIAIRTDARNYTYADVARRSAQYAHVLAADDVRPEERVIIALPDGVDFVAALFGILRRGSVVVMVNPDTTPELLRYFFEYTRATAAFVPAPRLDQFQAQAAGLPSAQRLYAVGGPEFETRLEAESAPFEPFDSHRDDAAIWLFSGGTTGRPKGVVQTHRSFVNTTRLYGQGVLGVSPDDITIAVPKLFFGYATGSNVFFPFSVGASCVLFPERCTADALFAQIARHKPTILVNVPTMIQQMVSHALAVRQVHPEGARPSTGSGRAGRDDHERGTGTDAPLSSVRLATSAGEPLPLELHERWMRAFGVELLDGLGTAEMWHIFISNRPGDVVAGTLGRVVPGFEVKLCDTDGNEVADGEIGALWVKGESRAIGYWRQMDDTMRVFRGDWCVTGDMLQRNADGTFTYCGRSDDLLKVHGRWLAPSELENCLLAHPAVREVAVVGATDTNGLVSPCAFVVSESASPELAEDLKAFARSRLDSYKSPREVVFLEAMPLTHLGKVDRGALARTRRGG
jgi:acyl-coenzyme A synthetase/AMP-(fatty) acid ligase